MERVFKSKDEMIFNLVDGDGFIVEEYGFVLPKDSIWYLDCEEDEGLIEPVHLIDENNQWIEIDIYTLELGFEEIK